MGGMVSDRYQMLTRHLTCHFRGLHRLRAGKYSAARDAFALCLVPADSTKKGNSFTGSKKSPAPNKSSIDSARVVDGIVAILDTSQHVSLPASHDDVSMDVSLGGDLRRYVVVPKNRQHKLTSRSSAPDSAKNRVANNSKDTQQRQQECIFYLERYGNTHSLLSYYLKHKLLEKACRHVIDRALSHATFVDYIVDHCLHVSLLPELKQMLKKIGTHFLIWLNSLTRLQIQIWKSSSPTCSRRANISIKRKRSKHW